MLLKDREFTISSKNSGYLKRGDWVQNEEVGTIKIERTKTDIFGRGTTVGYVKMQSMIDPIHWMNLYQENNKIGKGKKDPLFILSSGKQLDRNTLIRWLRKQAKLANFSNYKNLNGISFRRGCVQELKELGFRFNQFGQTCRWTSESCANRYIKVNAKIIKQFADAFDKHAMQFSAVG